MTIKLKELLNEIFHQRELYSWQHPSGEFITFKQSSHGAAAREIIKDYESSDIMMEMWKRGFMRIVYMGDTLIAHNEIHPPKHAQTKRLIELAVKAEMSYLEYDKGSDTKMLWSIHDQM